ncbi:CAZyme family AA3 [Penicillium canariense]|uniref:CAZyme family AA3 n=1 Tax=Penicillium canariense TaxID=189055 RepID=A0A9W9ID74_9EURO|nr:CAZyme family AA3 [Penicillium canariense]KAJ5175434.1 CAZyme family AA3 [Penicillium canariense]
MTSLETSSLAELREQYDYVVVGGGTAGLVVASRLTEDATVSVLVLEAGSNRVDDPRIAAPGLAASTYDDPEFDWCITSPPQEHLNGRCIAEPRGRTLGGSSAINLGMVIYPSRTDLDSWEQLGNEGWNWDNLSQYIKRSQTFTPPSSEIKEQLSLQYIDPAVQGESGPLQVSFGDGPFPTFNGAWPKVFESLNHRITGDPMSGIAKGAFCNPGSIHPTTRTRSHAGVTYYNPEVAKRPNLRVVTEALVEKILLEKKEHADAVATGVKFVGKDGVQKIVAAKHEVILAAGAIKTPHLLELSGIGDGTLLRSHGIQPIVENPNVGENLQEHGFVPFSWEVAEGQMTGEALRNPEIAAGAMAAWQQSGAGPLGLCAIASAYMTPPELQDGELHSLITEYLKSETLSPGMKAQYEVLRKMLEDEEEPSGQYTLAPFQITPEKGPSPKGIFGMTEPENFISIVSVLNRPFSRGTVHMGCSDPQAKPIFDPRFFSHPLDLELHARHVRWLETLAWTEPMASLLKPAGRRLQNSSRDISLETARELARDRIVAHYHVAGTTAMMPREKGGVVDPQLKVYGTQNLRVVDAGIFPLIPRGNIQATVFAVAEKAADIIRADAKARSH